MPDSKQILRDTSWGMNSRLGGVVWNPSSSKVRVSTLQEAQVTLWSWTQGLELSVLGGRTILQIPRIEGSELAGKAGAYLSSQSRSG